jgi:hypothetical protein
MKFINENIYSHGRGKICNLLNRSVQKFRGFTPTMILTMRVGNAKKDLYVCSVLCMLLINAIRLTIISFLFAFTRTATFHISYSINSQIANE